MPAPLHWALRRTVPEGSSTSRLARFSNASVVWIACWKAPSPSRLSSGRACEDTFEHEVDRQVVADPAGGGERDGGGVDADGERGCPLGLGGVVEAASTGGGVGAAGVDEHDAQGVQAAALARDEHGRGGVPGRGEARRADGRLGVADEQPHVGVAARLHPRGHAGGAEARGQARRRGRGRARARARAPSASGRTAAPRSDLPRSQQARVSGSPNITLRFCTACEEVPFQRLSIAENTSTLPVCSSAAAKMRQKLVSRTSRTPGGASTTSTNGSSA
jgi:hypothetical protein